MAVQAHPAETGGPSSLSRPIVGELLVAVLGAIVLVYAATQAPTAAPLHLTSMAESAAAMERAGEVMLEHGEEMRDEARRADAAALAALGDHWFADGQAVARGGRWMAMNPTSAPSLVSSPAELADMGTRASLERGARAMRHDPRGATDLEAMRWNGLAMRSEGRNMAEHGRVMAEDLQLMAGQHELSGRAARDVREAATTMTSVGEHLEANGRAMVDEADRLARAFALR